MAEDESDDGKMRRLTLEIALAVREQLERLKKDTKAPSLAEVIRWALRVFGAVVTAQEKGHKLIIQMPDGSKREIWFVI